MNNENINANDYSRNGSSAEKSLHWEGLNFINDLQAYLGENQRFHGCTLDSLANFFRNYNQFPRYFKTSNEYEVDQIIRLFKRIDTSLDFNVYLQRRIAYCMKGKFSSAQLCCIFQAFNGIWIQYDNSLKSSIKENLFDFIDSEGHNLYSIGDVDTFKTLIESINPFEFEIFVNLILEAWEGNFVGSLHDFLLQEND